MCFAPHGGRRWLGVVSNSRKTSDESSMRNRASHPNLLVRNKMLTIRLPHCGSLARRLRKSLGCCATVQRYVDAHSKGGLDGLRHSSVQKAVSELAACRDIIRASFKKYLRVRLPRRATESRS